MKTQQGFSALELIMVMAVSAILMTTLLQIYNQVTRNMLRVERFVFEDTQILTLKNRFGNDLTGISAIWFTQGDLEVKQAAKEAAKTPPTAEKKKGSKYFYSVNKDGHLDTLTFVTTSALQSYGSAQSRFVRIVYKVEKDLKYESMLRLMRKEIVMPTENIDEESLKAGKFYELVGGLKSIEMKYQLVDKIALEKSSSDKTAADKVGTKSENQEEKQPIIRSVKQWTGDDGKKKSNKKDEKNSSQNVSDDMSGEASARSEASDKEEDLGGAAVPKFVEMKIVFGATDKQLEKEYKLEFYIPSTLDSAPKEIVIQQAPAEVNSN